jgi:protein SCO1/2
MTSRLANIRTILLTVSVVLLAVVAGANLWRVYETRKWDAYDNLIPLPQPRVIADFALQDTRGAAFSLDGFKGHWSLLFFGYASCPDVCPTTLYQLQQARQLMLQQESSQQLPLTYFVSVDPDRDTAEKLRQYLAYFDPSIVGLLGAAEQLQALALQLGIAVHVDDHQPGDLQYNVDHSASVLLLDPEGRLYGVLPAPQQAASIAHDVLTVISRESS